MRAVFYNRALIPALEKAMRKGNDGFEYIDQNLRVKVEGWDVYILIMDELAQYSFSNPTGINERELFVNVHGADWYLDIPLKTEVPE